MEGTIVKHCKVCGATYEACVSCERNHSWKMHTDTAAHYYIFTVLMAYQADHDAKRAYCALEKRGVDLDDTAGYTPRVRALLAEIGALARKKGGAKRDASKTEKVKTADRAEDKAVPQQK